MSRFVINPLPNPPTVVFRAGGAKERIKVNAISPGLTVWFSSDYNELTNLKQDGNPGGWFLTGGAPPEDVTDIWIDGDLYAVTAAQAAEIEVSQLLHVKANASYTSTDPAMYSDTNGAFGSGPGFDQPELTASEKAKGIIDLAGLAALLGFGL